MKDYYEIHVTLAEDDGHYQMRWGYSRFDGDPTLGPGIRHYRTSHADSLTSAMELVMEAQMRWPKAIRYKIEHVILDIKRNSPILPKASGRNGHVCPKCGASDYLDASQSYDCNRCGHSW